MIIAQTEPDLIAWLIILGIGCKGRLYSSGINTYWVVTPTPCSWQTRQFIKVLFFMDPRGGLKVLFNKAFQAAVSS